MSYVLAVCKAAPPIARSSLEGFSSADRCVVWCIGCVLRKLRHWRDGDFAAKEVAFHSSIVLQSHLCCKGIASLIRVAFCAQHVSIDIAENVIISKHDLFCQKPWESALIGWGVDGHIAVFRKNRKFFVDNCRCSCDACAACRDNLFAQDLDSARAALVLIACEVVADQSISTATTRSGASELV